MSTKFTAYDPNTGKVLFSGTGDTPEIMESAEVFIHLDEVFSDGWISEGLHYDVPSKPSINHVFNWSSKVWEDPRTLGDLKQSKWEDIKKARASALIHPILSTRFGDFDADTAGIASIKDTVLGLNEAAKVGASPTSITWTLADNTSIELTPLELSEVSAMLLSRGNAAYTRARELREEVYSSETDTIEKVEAITW